MASEEALMVCTLATVYVILLRKSHSRRTPCSVWVRDVLLKRKEQDTDANLVKDLKDTPGYRKFFGMEHRTFLQLLELVKPLIMHKDTKVRDAIKPGQRLAGT